MGETNQFCSYSHCGKPADYFCICTAHTSRLCTYHLPIHKEKPVFHFTPPIHEFDFFDSNKQTYITCARNLVDCQAKLSADLLLVSQCRGEIEAAVAGLIAELKRRREELLGVLGVLEAHLRVMVEDGVAEMNAGPFHQTYNTFVGSIYECCYQNPCTPLEVFRYNVSVREECLKDCLSISFSSCLPELFSLNREETEGFLTKQIAELQFEINTLKAGHSPAPPQDPSPVFNHFQNRVSAFQQGNLRKNIAGNILQPHSPPPGHLPPLFPRPQTALRRLRSEEELEGIPDIGRAYYGPLGGRPQGNSPDSHQWANIREPRPTNAEEPGEAFYGGRPPGNYRPANGARLGVPQAWPLPPNPRDAYIAPGLGRPERQ